MKRSEITPAIGIDLGTTNCCVGIWLKNHVEIIPNSAGKRTTPSVISFEDTHTIIGETAKEKLSTSSSNVISVVKRFIGKKYSQIDPQDLEIVPYKVEENLDGNINICIKELGKEIKRPPYFYSSIILKQLKSDAEMFLGKPVEKAVITVPANFTSNQRDATRIAGETAGLKILGIINEPTAAALAYGLDKKLKSQDIVLVFDLGGGTFDVTLLKLDEDTFEVIATDGISHLGGEDFDTLMAKNVAFENGLDLNNKELFSKIKYECEKAKINDFEGSPIFIYKGEKIFLGGISKNQFICSCRHYFEQCISKVEEVLKTAEVPKEKVNEIVMVGGSSKIQALVDMVNNYFGKKPNTSINADEAVAVGASIYGAMLSHVLEYGLCDISLFDVCPFTLGINSFMSDDAFEATLNRIIPKNTPLPITKSKSVRTRDDNQTTMRLKVYQGEYDDLSKDFLLGTFLLTNLPPKPKGEVSVNVEFELDLDGILIATATASEKDGGSTESITIINENPTIKKEDIEKYKKEIKEKYSNKDGILLFSDLEQLEKQYKEKESILEKNILAEKIVNIIERKIYLNKQIGDDNQLKRNELKLNFKILLKYYEDLYTMNISKKYSREYLQKQMQDYLLSFTEEEVFIVKNILSIRNIFKYGEITRSLSLYKNAFKLVLEEKEEKYATAQRLFNEILSLNQQIARDLQKKISEEDGEAKKDRNKIMEINQKCHLYLNRIDIYLKLKEAKVFYNSFKSKSISKFESLYQIYTTEQLNIHKEFTDFCQKNKEFIKQLNQEKLINSINVLPIKDITDNPPPSISEMNETLAENIKYYDTNKEICYEKFSQIYNSIYNLELNDKSKKVDDPKIGQKNFEWEATCLAYLAIILFEIMNSTDCIFIRQLVQSSLNIIDSLHLNIIHIDFYNHLKSILSKLEEQLELDKYEKKDFKINYIKKYPDIFKEIENAFNKSEIDFLHFILKKYPYKNYEGINVEDMLKNNRKKLILKLRKGYDPFKYGEDDSYKSKEEYTIISYIANKIATKFQQEIAINRLTVDRRNCSINKKK